MPLTRPPAARWLLCVLLATGTVAQAVDAPPSAHHALQGLQTPVEATRWLEAGPATAGTDGISAAWWEQFKDAVLTHLVTKALSANADVRQAQASLAQALAQQRASEAGQQLQIGTTGSASRQRSGGMNSNQLKGVLSASWSPDVNGTQAAELDRVAALVTAEQASVASTELRVAAEVTANYLQWRDTQARIALTERSLRSFEETQVLTQWRAQAGLATGLDVDTAALNTAQTRASLAPLRTQLAQYEHQLALLGGLTPLQLHGSLAVDPALQIPAAALNGLSAGVPADLLRRRPDVAAAQANLLAQWAATEGTRRAARPSLSLTGSIGWQAATLAGLGQPGSAVASLLGAVSWTLWDNGERQALIDRDDAALQAQRAAFDATLLSAVTDVEDRLVALQQQRLRLPALEQAAQSADAVWQATKHRQAAGLTDVTALLVAQRNALSAWLSLQSARTDLLLALTATWRALGGGWAGVNSSAASAPVGAPAT